MFKWLIEIVMAFKLKRQLQSTFWQALRFVRCDLLCQQEICKILGIEDSHKED